MSDFPTWERRSPIRSDQGIQARGQRGGIGKRWWSTRWIAVLADLSHDGGARLARGRGYARQGQVLQVEEERGGIRALVQGSRARPYEVGIRLASHAIGKRSAVLDALAAEAGHLASILTGELTEAVAEAFAAAEAPLFPTASDDLELRCSCPDPVSPCKHVAAVQYLFAERLDDDPLLLLRLRGWDVDALLAALQSRQEANDADATGSGDVAKDPLALPEPTLAESLARFWRAGRGLARSTASPLAPPVPLPVLRRLGQPEFLEADLARLLGPAIARAAEAARRLAEEGAEAGGTTDAGPQ